MDHVMQTAPRPASELKQVLGRAAIIATILGSALALLNQSDAILGDAEIQRLPLILVYLTPFLVVSVSQVFGIRQAQKASVRMMELRESFAETLVSHGIPARAAVLALAAGGISTAIVATDSMLAGGSLDQLPAGLILQALTLPAVFGALSQTLAFRRTIRRTVRPGFAAA